MDVNWHWPWVVIGTDGKGVARVTAPGPLSRDEMVAVTRALQMGEDVAALQKAMTEAKQKRVLDDARGAGLVRVRVVQVADLPDLDTADRWHDDGKTINVMPAKPPT